MRKMIIFVEDKVLKKVIQAFLKKHNKEFPVRIPTRGGGWNTVIERVLNFLSNHLLHKILLSHPLKKPANWPAV